MKRWFLLAALLPFTAAAESVAPAPKVAPAAAEVDAVLAGIQSFYGEARDLKAGFTQVYTYTVYNRKQTSKGTVFLKKPGKMRWDYQSPVPKAFFSDGQTLWVFEPNENQVFKRSLKHSQLPVALTFMSGEGQLAEAFNAKLLKAPDASSYRVELIPKTDEGDYKALHLTVDKTTFAVKSSTVIDPIGNTNQIVFSDVKTNLGLPDGGFVFKVPAGTRVITDPQR